MARLEFRDFAKKVPSESDLELLNEIRVYVWNDWNDWNGWNAAAFSRGQL
jgi:hypothetical protein